MIEAPIFLEPRLFPRVWGGDRLAREFGRTLGEEPVGESWEIHGDLLVEGSGQTLDQLCREHGEQLLGRAVEFSGSFPILTKWLDCKAWLSVQVHPDDALARELTGDPGARGKTEAWYVHRADSEAQLIHGLAPGVTASQLREPRGESIVELLSRHSSQAGDLLFTAAGVVHALGPGNFIYEVQQSCDLTYRFYDWGRDREVHPEKAARCAEEAVDSGGRVDETSLSCPYFRMQVVTGETGFELDGCSFEIIATTSAAVDLRWSGGQRTLPPGTSVLLPANLGQVELGGEISQPVLRIGVPE